MHNTCATKNNQDESGYFKSFLVNNKVWAGKGGRWVARRRGYDRTHIKAMVCMSAAGKTITPAPLWIGKTVHGRLFSKKACPVFIQATQCDGQKDSRKATSSTHSNTQNSKQKQKETKGGWSDAATFMEWVRKVFVVEVHPKQNEYGCVVLIVDGSKTHPVKYN